MATPVKHEYTDIVVAGGGPAGVCAAVSAARTGRKTLLIEKNGFLGGMATAAMFAPWQGFLSDAPSFASSIAAEIINRLEAAHACRLTRRDVTSSVMFDVDILRTCLHELVADSGADLLFQTTFLRASVSHAHITSILAERPECVTEIEAGVFIDATGNGDLAASCGEPFVRSSDPLSYNFIMAGVEFTATNHWLVCEQEHFRKVQADWRASSALLHQSSEICITEGIVPLTALVSMIALPSQNILTTDGIMEAEASARALLPAAISFLRTNIPGFEHAQLEREAGQVGCHSVRLFENRHAEGFDDESIRIAVPGIPEETTLITSSAMRASRINNMLLAGRLLLAPELLYATNNQPASMALGETAGFLAVSL